MVFYDHKSNEKEMKFLKFHLNIYIIKNIIHKIEDTENIQAAKIAYGKETNNLETRTTVSNIAFFRDMLDSIIHFHFR